MNFTSQCTYKSSYPTWQKQVAGGDEAGLHTGPPCQVLKDGAHDDLSDRDEFQHSSVMPHFTARRGK